VTISLQTNLRGRIAKIGGELTGLVTELDASVNHIDGAVFGYRPTSTPPVEKDSPVADSLEAEVERIERLIGRLSEINKNAAAFLTKLDGSGQAPAATETYAETRRYA
jgi:hypothetical protein